MKQKGNNILTYLLWVLGFIAAGLLIYGIIKIII